MEKLTNAELLEDTVSNSNTLKSKRLEKTSSVSGNPNPNPVNMQNNIQQSADNVVTEPKSETMPIQEYIKPAISERNEKTKNDDDKILGINKYLFYIGVGLVLVGGGYLVYNKYFKKSAGSKLPSGSGSSTGQSAPAIAK